MYCTHEKAADSVLLKAAFHEPSRVPEEGTDRKELETLITPPSYTGQAKNQCSKGKDS
ncbi:hypothetical protein CCP4SC76_2160002 [Gammaproteobacteria bacterium]